MFGYTLHRLVRMKGMAFSKASAQRSAALAALSIFRSLRGEAVWAGGISAGHPLPPVNINTGSLARVSGSTSVEVK